MSNDRRLTLFHAANSRSTGVVMLKEELKVDYDLHVLDMKNNEQRGAAYLAINPMGKVPAVKHGDALITELAVGNCIELEAEVHTGAAVTGDHIVCGENHFTSKCDPSHNA